MSQTNKPSSNGLPQGDEKRAAVQSMFDTIAPKYDRVNRIMTFRLDVAWRKRTIKSLGLEAGSLVLDLACGTGDFCQELSKNGHTPIGVDLSFGMLAAANHDFTKLQGDLLSLPLADSSVDGAVCGFALRNLVELEPFFLELSRVIRPSGSIALLEVSQPDNKVISFGHNIYFNKIVPKIGGLISNKSAYEYLPKSVSYLPTVEELKSMLQKAGLTNVERKQLTGGLSQLYTANVT